MFRLHRASRRCSFSVKGTKDQGLSGCQEFALAASIAVEFVMDLSDCLGRGPWSPESCQDSALTLCRPKIYV